MNDQRLYTRDEVVSIAQQAVLAIMNLDNDIADGALTDEEGDTDMGKRIKKRVTVNGKHCWVTGDTDQECMDNYIKLCMREGVVAQPVARFGQNGSRAPYLKDYLPDYMAIFKNKQQTITKVNRDRIIRNHILPKFGERRVDDITTGDIQRWFDELALEYSKETILKIKNILSPALDAAVEDGYIQKNPIKSSRISIGGRQTVHHKAIPSEVMDDIRKNLWTLQMREKRMATLLAYTGMRFEQVLGLRWQDIDFDRRVISIKRAVVHPTRNQPEVKATKTESSTRSIPLPRDVGRLLIPFSKSGFVLSSPKDGSRETPLSYSQARNMFNRIRKRFQIQEYSAHDFRDTCATEWRQHGIPTDVIARMLGHTKSQITERRYVKYREELYNGVRDVMDGISDASCDT